MRRSPILEDFAVVSKRSKASPEDPSNLTATLEDIERCRATIRQVKAEYGVKLRSQIVVCAFELGEKATIKGLAARFKTDVKYIKTWLRRFNEQGFEGLKDAPRKGRPPVHDEEQILISLNILLATKPKELTSTDAKLDMALRGRVVWSVPLLSRVMSLPKSTLYNIVKKYKIDVAPKDSWCISNDPNYEPKLRRCHELYKFVQQYSGDDEVVLCFDEKPCIQAIERHVIRLSKGRVRFGSRYERHGITHLFAVLNVKTGQVYFQFRNSKTREDVKDFLHWVVTNHPELHGKKIHLILDNLVTHKNLGDAWYAEHPNLHFNFTPTCASWVNLVESFFGIFTRCCLKNASWDSVEELVEVCTAWFKAYNLDPTHFKWTFKIDRHLDQRNHSKESLNKVLLQDELNRLVNGSTVASHMNLKLACHDHSQEAVA